MLIINLSMLLKEGYESQILVTGLVLGVPVLFTNIRKTKPSFRKGRKRSPRNVKPYYNRIFNLADFVKLHLQLRVHPAGVKGALGVHVRVHSLLCSLTAELQTGGTMIYRDEGAAPVFCCGRPVLTHFAAAISRD